MTDDYQSAYQKLQAENQKLTKRLEEAELEVQAFRAVAARVRQVANIVCKPHMSYSGVRYEQQFDKMLAESEGEVGKALFEELRTLRLEKMQLASLTAQLAAAEAERDRMTKMAEAMRSQVEDRIEERDVAQREAAELRKLVEAVAAKLEEAHYFSASGAASGCSICKFVLTIEPALARLTPAKPAAVEGGGE